MTDQETRDVLFAMRSEFRQRIVKYLNDPLYNSLGPTVNELARGIRTSPERVRRELNVLEQAGVVRRQKYGLDGIRWLVHRPTIGNAAKELRRLVYG